MCCPHCGGQKIWKDGLRHIGSKAIQRFLCRGCGYRFSESQKKVNIASQIFKTSHSGKNMSNSTIGTSNLAFKKQLNGTSFGSCKNIGSQGYSPEFTVIAKPLKALSCYSSKRQICVSNKEMKNLVKVETRQEKALREGTTKDAETKGKLFEFSWWMNKQGYAKASIRGYLSCLRTLWNRGANIFDSESVKEVMAIQKWSANRKRVAINSYSLFLKMQGLKWEKPRCKVTRKIPFIPTEKELDTLIAGCGKKTATFLKLLKETAMRSGEAKRLLWTNIDSERRVITLNDPEKGSNPRAWKVTLELIGMLNCLPKKSTRIFGDGPITSQKTTFYRTRKRLAHKLQNPRLMRISFHTFRHWKATTLYHQTKDPYYVKDFLGHKSIKSTEIYITIERTIFQPSNDEYTVKIAKDPKDIKDLLEAGFEYVCNKEELVFLRKRK